MEHWQQIFWSSLGQEVASLMKVCRKASLCGLFRRKDKKSPLYRASSLEIVGGSYQERVGQWRRERKKVEKPCGERLMASTPEIKGARGLRARHSFQVDTELRFFSLFFFPCEKNQRNLNINIHKWRFVLWHAHWCPLWSLSHYSGRLSNCNPNHMVPKDKSIY